MKETLARIACNNKSTRLGITVLGGAKVGKSGEFLFAYCLIIDLLNGVVDLLFNSADRTLPDGPFHR